MTCDYAEHPDCQCQGEVKPRESLTQYVWNGEGKDPNAVTCCDSHYEVYQDYWNEMWDEYYSAIGFPRNRQKSPSTI